MHTENNNRKFARSEEFEAVIRILARYDFYNFFANIKVRKNRSDFSRRRFLQKTNEQILLYYYLVTKTSGDRISR